MKPAPFEYHDPRTVREVVELLDEHEHDAELLAGNQSLGIIMANRLATPDALIDLNGVDDLAGIDIQDDHVAIGAMTRHRDVERADDLREIVPMLPDAAAQIAGPSVRNRGTLGGSIGEADPAGNYPTALVALDADIHIASVDGERSVPARDYFIAYMFTDLAEHELVTHVTASREPFPPDRTGMAFVEFKRAAQTFPSISAAAAIRVDDPGTDAPTVEEARLALGNAGEIPLHVADAESAVEGTTLTEAILDEAAAAAKTAVDPAEEMHADAAWKEDLAAEYARRALETAYDRVSTA